MKSFRQLVSEVAQPKAEDEINFKEKHVIDHIIDPNAEEDQFTADTIKKFKNKADYDKGEDMAVYEGTVTLKRDIPGQEDNDVDNDGDNDMADAQLRYRRHAQIKQHRIDESWSDGVSSRNAHMHASTAAKYRKKANDSATMAKRHDKDSPEYSKHMADYHSAMAKSIKSSYHAGDYGSVNSAKKDHKIEMDKAKEYRSSIKESLDPVGREDSDIDNDGKITKSDAYLHARRRAISKKLKKEGLEPVTPAGGEYDSEETHKAYKKANKKNAGIKEAATNPYAIGTAQAMKATGDKPPLKKSTINLAHKIAKGVEKKEDVSQIEPRAGLRIFAGNTKKAQIGETTEVFVEAYSAGNVKLKDGSSVKLSKQDADLLNKMFNDLNPTNRKRMQGVLVADKNGFNEILGFAREAL